MSINLGKNILNDVKGYISGRISISPIDPTITAQLYEWTEIGFNSTPDLTTEPDNFDYVDSSGKTRTITSLKGGKFTFMADEKGLADVVNFAMLSGDQHFAFIIQGREYNSGVQVFGIPNGKLLYDNSVAMGEEGGISLTFDLDTYPSDDITLPFASTTPGTSAGLTAVTTATQVIVPAGKPFYSFNLVPR